MRRWIWALAGLGASAFLFTGTAGSQVNPPPASEAVAAETASPPADFAAVAAALAGTTETLGSGIANVALGTEVPIKAKFEIEDGVLMLSVYTSEKGLAVAAEESVFKEYKGAATAAAWSPEVTIFEDFQHVARSAQEHTLLSITAVTLSDIIERASALGVVLSVKPVLVDRAPVFEAITASGGVVTTTLYDLLTAEVYVAPAAEAGGVPPPATPVVAEGTGADVWGQAGCFACHGELAEGGADPALPRGPNLRRTRLDRAGLVETISCGRPGTEMPYNLDVAYTEHACYGMPLGPAPADVFPGAGITAAQVDLLVDFLVSDVVGKTRVTKANCILFFGGDANARACADYP